MASRQLRRRLSAFVNLSLGVNRKPRIRSRAARSKLTRFIRKLYLKGNLIKDKAKHVCCWKLEGGPPLLTHSSGSPTRAQLGCKMQATRSKLLSCLLGRLLVSSLACLLPRTFVNMLLHFSCVICLLALHAKLDLICLLRDSLHDISMLPCVFCNRQVLGGAERCLERQAAGVLGPDLKDQRRMQM